VEPEPQLIAQIALYVQSLTPWGDDGDLKADSATCELRGSADGRGSAYGYLVITVQNPDAYRTLEAAWKADKPVGLALYDGIDPEPGWVEPDGHVSEASRPRTQMAAAGEDD
jgi:hypothetical protein